MSLCDPTFQRALVDELLDLNYHALLHVVALLLTRMGYEQVALIGRTGYVGRNEAGGCDLLGYRRVPGGRRTVVIQVKQYAPTQAIFRRTVAELRGTCLEQRAAEGMLITTGCFSPSISQTGFASATFAPVRFIDGTHLADLLALYRVGVTRLLPSPTQPCSRFEIDRTFFADMERKNSGVARPHPSERQVVGMLVIKRPRKRRT